MQEINDIFFDSDAPSFAENLNMYYALTDSANAHILSLSEVFTEWYLFDSSHEKDIQKFLDEENLNDIFSESEFMDLMCGNAYVDTDTVQLIALKLPFNITINKLHILNQYAEKNNPLAYCVKHKLNLIDKLCEIQESRKNRTKQHKKEYYKKNKDYIKQKELEYRLNNQESIKKQKKAYYEKNKDHLKQYGCEYYLKNKDRAKENSLKYRSKNKDRIKEYYATHKELFKGYATKLKQNKDTAKTMCAVYVFLLKLRKSNPEQYLNLYTKHQEPLKQMLKTCIALQNKDINMCPLCNKKCGNSLEQNCNQKVLSLPGAIKKIKIIAKDIKQR